MKPSEYRIRWAIVTMSKGGKARMCIAERLVRFFGIPLFWCPVENWRRTEAEARYDAAYDAEMRKPLPKPISI